MLDGQQERLNMLYELAAKENDSQKFEELLLEIIDLLDRKHDRQAKAKGA
jgi:hypothetical protein